MLTHRGLQAFESDGTWNRQGPDLPHEKDIVINAINMLDMTPDGTFVLVGQGGVGRIDLYEYNAQYDNFTTVVTKNEGGRFGKSVSLSSDGSRFAVGKYDEANFTGVVQVYEKYENGTWATIGQDIFGDNEDDWAGYSVALSGDGTRLAVGIPFSDPNNDFSKGIVRVYRWESDSTWGRLGSDIIGEAAGDRSGIKVVMSKDGRTIAIAATHNDAEDEADLLRNTGQVRVYSFSILSRWEKKGSDIDGLESYIGNPMDIAITPNGDQVIIGYPGASSDTGQVVVYKYGDDWEIYGDIIRGEAESYQFGYSVSMSDNGNVIMIAAPGAENSIHSGIGFVYKFNETNQTWAYVSSESSDTCFSAKISADGGTVASMTPTSTQVFKFFVDSPVPSMAPSVSFSPSILPSVSQLPSISLEPTINTNEPEPPPSPPFYLLLLPLVPAVFFAAGFALFSFGIGDGLVIWLFSNIQWAVTNIWWWFLDTWWFA